MSGIFFPLRSNVEWFESTRRAYTLERKVKESMLLYDRLVFETGTYTCTVTERGSWDFRTPSLPREEREKMPRGDQGGRAFVVIEDPGTGHRMTVASGEVERHFYADFLDILEPLGYEDLNFIELSDVALTSQGKSLVGRISWRDVRDESLTSLIPGSYFLKKKVINGLNHSLVLSSSLRVPILVDELHENVLRHKLNLAVSEIYGGKRVEALDSILRIIIPDFSSLDVNEIIELRKDKALATFREKISEVVHRVSSSVFEDPLQFKEEAQHLFVRDLIKEIREMAPSGEDILLDAFLGLVPFPLGEVASVVKTAYEAYEYSKRWTAFVFKLLDARM